MCYERLAVARRCESQMNLFFQLLLPSPFSRVSFLYNIQNMSENTRQTPLTIRLLSFRSRLNKASIKIDKDRLEGISSD